MWQVILGALIKQMQAHPEQVFALLEKIIDLLSKHPDAMAVAVKMAQSYVPAAPAPPTK